MKTSQIVNYAYQKVPFYNYLYSDIYNEWVKSGCDMKLLPFTTKDMIIHENERMLSSEYFSKKNQNELAKCRTSGSTGKCLMIQWDKAEYKKSLLPLWFERKKAANIFPWDRYCYFFTTTNYKDKETVYVEHDRNGLGFNKSELSEDTMIDIYKIMLDYNPVWLLLQPSIAILMSNVIQKYNMPILPELRYIELSGEMLFQNVRKMLEKTFQCTIRNQYGCNEVNSIAYECSNGNMHCISSNLNVEILSNDCDRMDPNEGEICVTSFVNHAMPFIRYRTGDIGRFRIKEKCKCGNKNPILELTKGRWNDFIYDESGEKLNSYIFVHAINMANIKYKECIKQFQVIQTEINKFIFKIVINEEDLDEFEEIVQEVVNHITHPALSNAIYTFEQCSLLEIEKNGKLRYFQNQMIS